MNAVAQPAVAPAAPLDLSFAMEPPISVRGVDKRYDGQTVLAGANLQLEPGAVLGLIGRNGAGKSTLMKVMIGQIDPDEGKPASQLTEVRVLYDDEALYVGVRLHDTGPVTARLGRRDMPLGDSDWFGLAIDSYHDHRTAFGLKLQVVGANPRAAVHAGLELPRGVLVSGEKSIFVCEYALDRILRE